MFYMRRFFFGLVFIMVISEIQNKSAYFSCYNWKFRVPANFSHLTILNAFLREYKLFSSMYKSSIYW